MNPLNAYTYDFTQTVLDMNVPPLTGYDTQLDHVFHILHRKEKMSSKYNPLLLDLDGVSRWHVISEVARRMATGEVPFTFTSTRIMVLDYEALLLDRPSQQFAMLQKRSIEKEEWGFVSDAADEDDEDKWEEFWSEAVWPPIQDLYAPGEILSRLKALFLALHQTEGQVLLFVDHFHRIIGGEKDRYPFDAGILLKPILARREMQLIGACTFAEYRQYVLRDVTTYRRLQEVRLTEEK